MGTFIKAVRLSLALMLVSLSGMASGPNWTRVDYTNSTTFIGYILADEFVAGGAQPGDFIGAFVGDECRMIAELFKSPISDTLYVSSVIHGGGINPPNDPDPVSNDGETVVFKLWRTATSVEQTLDGSAATIPGGHIALHPLGKPDASSKAELATIAITGKTLAPAFSADVTEYTVELENETELPAETDYLVTAAERGTVTIEYATGFPAANVTTITVKSEDETTTEVYTVTFNVVPSGCLVEAPSVNTPDAICEGKETTLTATGLAGATFSWKNAAGTEVSTDATYKTGIAGTYTVTQTDGCTGPAASVIVTVKSAPTITINNSVIPAQVCNTAGTIDISALASPAGGVYSGAGVTGTTLDVAGLPAGTSTVTYTAEADGCLAFEEVSFQVLEPQQALLTGLPASKCSSEPAFNLSGGTPAGGKYFIDGAESVDFIPADYNGQVTVTYGSADACLIVASHVITVNPAPAKLVVSGKLSRRIAETAEPLFVENAAAGADVIWKDAAGSTLQSDANGSYTPTATAEGIYTYTVYQTLNGCGSPVTEVTYQINDCETDAPTAAQSEYQECVGADLSISVAALAGHTVIWKTENGQDAGTGESLTVSTLDPTSAEGITFFASQSAAAGGCESPQTKITVVVNAVPVVTITAPETIVVTASPVTITLTPASAVLSAITGLQGNVFSPENAGLGQHILSAAATVNGCQGSATHTITVEDETPEPVDNTALTGRIAIAKNLTAVQGYARDQYIDAASAQFALNNAIDAAEAKISSATQAEINAALEALETAITEFTGKANPADYTALKTAIDAAEAKVAAIGTSVGSEPGQYPSNGVSLLTAAIPTATALYGTSDQTAINSKVTELNNLASIQPNQAPGIDLGPLTDAIAAAKTAAEAAAQGYAVGQYSKLAETKAPLLTSIEKAEELLVSLATGTQAQIDAAAAKLTEDKDTFVGKANTVNFQTLADAIAAAEAKLAQTIDNVGTGVGQYSAADVNTLTAAIEAAKAALGENANFQDVFNAVVEATDIKTNPEEDPAVVYTDLESLIAELETAVAAAVVGTEPGNYSQNAKTAVEAAIEAAKQALDATSQEDVDAALDVLTQAKKVFEDSEVVLVLDYDALEALIAEAIVLLEKNGIKGAPGDGYFDARSELSKALNAAEKLVADGASNQGQITISAADLTASMRIFEMHIETPVSVITAEVKPTLVKNYLTISGLNASDIVKIVNVTGIEVSIETNGASVVAVQAADIATGTNYVVITDAKGNVKTVAIIVE
jgi:hypothetical protein